MRGRRWPWELLAIALAAPLPALADAQGDFARAVAADLAGDQARAFTLYLVAARAGVAQAQLNVAVMYDSGRGTRRDAAQAALFYAFAAVNGNARAAYDLGLLYESGDGVSRNPAVANAWYRKADAAGLAAAAEKLRGRTLRHASETAIRPATPVFPGAGVSLNASEDFVPFVWLAPPGDTASLSYVQVVKLDGAAWRDVFTQVADGSATRTQIGKTPGAYAWRVFSFGPSQQAYTNSPWVRFSVRDSN